MSRYAGANSLGDMNREPLPATATGPSAPRTLDTGMFGRAGSTACYLIPGPRPALIDSGAASTADAVVAALEAEGVSGLDSIVLTHIHFDHAGGAGHLARRFPDATVYVHERVAAHLVDPSRLTKAVRSVWGERTDRLFGAPLPVPEERIEAIGDGSRIPLGDRDLTAVATPGHTRAHLAFLDEATGALACGDALGIHLAGATRPATPPADFSLDDSLRTIEAVRGLGPTSLHVGHFGEIAGDPAEACDRAAESLRRWYEAFERERLRAADREGLLRRFECTLEAGLEPAAPAVRRQLELVNPAWLNVDGMTIHADRSDRA